MEILYPLARLIASVLSGPLESPTQRRPSKSNVPLFVLNGGRSSQICRRFRVYIGLLLEHWEWDQNRSSLTSAELGEVEAPHRWGAIGRGFRLPLYPQEAAGLVQRFTAVGP